MITQLAKLALVSTGAFILFAGPTHAVELNPYVNAGIGWVDAEGRTKFNGVVSGVFRGGVEISPYFALEGEGQIGLSEKTRETFISDTRFDENTYKFDHQFGIYALGRLPISEAVSIHARAGYAAYQSTDIGDQFFEDELPVTITTKYEIKGLSLGLGGQYMFGVDRLNGIRLDSFMIIDVDNSPDVDSGLPDINGTAGFSVTYVRKF